LSDRRIHHFLAPLLGFLLLGLLGAQAVAFDHAVLEHLDRGRHLADLVAPVAGRNLGVGVAPGQRAHGGGHGDHRLGDAAAGHPRHRDAEHHRDQAEDDDEDLAAGHRGGQGFAVLVLALGGLGLDLLRVRDRLLARLDDLRFEDCGELLVQRLAFLERLFVFRAQGLCVHDLGLVGRTAGHLLELGERLAEAVESGLRGIRLALLVPRQRQVCVEPRLHRLIEGGVGHDDGIAVAFLGGLEGDLLEVGGELRPGDVQNLVRQIGTLLFDR
jgi:hypothetical protein